MSKAWLVTKTDTQYAAALTQLDESQLPDGDVTVGITNSRMNYKDALALTGKGPVVRRFPLIPGIDLAGIVEESNSPDFLPGDKVILTGWEIGEIHWGGLSELGRVRPEWLIKLPAAFTLAQAMAIGTAGFTAMLAVMALEKFGITSDRGEILVTGASGGVGGFAISLLSRCIQIAAFELEGHFTAVKTRTMMPSLRLNLGQTVLRRKREECSAFAFPAIALHINDGQTSDVVWRFVRNSRAPVHRFNDLTHITVAFKTRNIIENTHAPVRNLTAA